jgi:hypothetical protein
MSVKSVVFYLAEKIKPGNTITGYNFCSMVQRYLINSGLPRAMESTILRRMRESNMFDYISPLDSRNPNHYKSFYIRRK